MICSTIRSIRLKNSWIICKHQNWILCLSIVDLLATEAKRPCKLCKKLCWIHLGFFRFSYFGMSTMHILHYSTQQKTSFMDIDQYNRDMTITGIITANPDIRRVTSPDLFSEVPSNRSSGKARFEAHGHRRMTVSFALLDWTSSVQLRNLSSQFVSTWKLPDFCGGWVFLVPRGSGKLPLKIGLRRYDRL